MSYPAPTPEQARAWQAAYSRRRRGFLALNAVMLVVALWTLPQWDALSARPGGTPLWAILGGIAIAMVGLVVGGVVWRCPRCHLQFGRTLHVRECPECHLRFE